MCNIICNLLDILSGWLSEWQFWVALMPAASSVAAVCKYRDSKRQQEFDNYHNLIAWINRSKTGGSISLQVQQAAIFELRNYKRYKDLTIKLLKPWADKTIHNLKELEQLEAINKLADSAKDTLSTLERK